MNQIIQMHQWVRIDSVRRKRDARLVEMGEGGTNTFQKLWLCLGYLHFD